MKLIGERIRRRRERMNMNQSEFAEKVDISVQFLSDIEGGKRGMSADTLYKICQGSDLSADYLLFGRESFCVSTPISEMVGHTPEPYRLLMEEMIRLFCKAIEIAQAEGRLNGRESGN